MLRRLPLLTHWMIHRSPAILQRFASRSSSSPPSGSGDQPRARLYPGQQQTVEELAQGIIPNQAKKRDIEQMYEFEKLEINDQPATRDQYRHHVKRPFKDRN